ncbi:TFC4 (YGR047C) [Zygosaccharomyces parabailii]|uniref:ZYBA0S14-00804g1_1 n=1 Tax=Zygosaccharomyces bailii (strain CLIB 213 / ATCC 58445 / CBS 680 / BCRC 21525 / NBRC 1098 / NCYC 1416 / NRRL Y-2227) TaxID=1333698 RepID=A0A8J2XED3_ZYGB2|nr:TFC4 (YGR047C) [Zygosaccharomyces parabailii]CDF91775.1 ZYBA0S14-00804g1_1 [Zygosaccharomyces bailii CLIB 213]CDH13353.1 probable Transcription factor tau 131 kDa subunit [Zygosaccharomyces bailii ISA1307]
MSNPLNMDVELTNWQDEQQGNEEQFYDHIDDLKILISDDEADDIGLYPDKGSEGYHTGSEDDSLLAEFSDYGEVSEDDEQDFMDAIREANNFKVKRKRKDGKGKPPPRTRRGQVVDPEVAQLLSEANEAFVRSDLQVAERLYNEVIKKDAKNFVAYETLGDIYQLQGRLNDCCNSWFLAAHLNSSDWEFWKIVANLSADLAHIRQAIYCYSRVVNINHEEWECIYRRSLLYKEIGQIGRALEGFQKLYAHNPLDGNILRELAVLYVEYNRINDAIDIYLEIFEANVKRRNAIILASENALESSEEGSEKSSDRERDPQDESQNHYEELNGEEVQMFPGVNWKKIRRKYSCIPFDWSSLNILAELFLKLTSRGSLGIKTIKRCARWIEHRETQIFWDDVNDDSEFDDRRYKNSRFDVLAETEKIKSYGLPIDVRIRLGLLRLNNDNVIEALNHFQFLYDENFADIADLYFEVAIALSKAEKHKEAIDFFTPLLAVEEYCTLDLFKPLARCYKEVEDYNNAKQYYEKVVFLEPEDLEEKLVLAEVHYHLGDVSTFNQLLLEVVEARKRQANQESSTNLRETQNIQQSNEKDVSAKPLLEDSMFRRAGTRKKRTPQDTERERTEREKRITSKVLDKYKKLAIYRKGLEIGDQTQTTLWIDTVSDLIDVFSSVKNYFMKSRSKKFVGIIRRTRKFNKVIDYKIERLSKLSEGDSLLDGLPLMEERVTLTSTTELRGLSYDQWFELFMDLALVITKYQSVEDGLSVIDTAQEVNVFFQNPERAKMMKFVKLAIALHTEDEKELTENLRNLLNQFQFNRKVLQVFMFSLVRGQISLDILSSTVQQKFFLRQLKAFDSIRYGKRVNGQASITNKSVKNPHKLNSPYLYYIYALLLYSSRSFLSALQYFKKMEPDAPNDFMLNFMMGLSHLHRSMQRLTASRHFQILHGLRYIYRYYEIRKTLYTELEEQEADYNLGRAFHLLGLVSIAVENYNRVLDNYDDDKLKKHAAYNLITIYQESGNTKFANQLMEKYLSV